jgi:transcriptional regulator with XRE-family HTH domain
VTTLTEQLQRLRDARLAAGLTQEELALLAGVSPSAVSRAERGLAGTLARISGAARIAELAP